MAKLTLKLLLLGCLHSAALAHAASVLTPREMVSLINAVDTLDQAASDILSGDNSRMNLATDGDKWQKLMDIEFAIDHSLDKLYVQSGMHGSGAVMIAGLHVGIANRRLLGNEPLTSLLPQRLTRPECRADLSLNRTFQRYTRAVAKDDVGEQFLLLMDYQNALNCLGGAEAKMLATSVGLSLRQVSSRVDDSAWIDHRKRLAASAVFNPALMLFDLTKYQGYSWLYFWLHKLKVQYQGIANDDVRVFLHDFFTGSLVSINTQGRFDLNELIDPGNLGTGACSLLEMHGSGMQGGSFACARGLSCGASDSINIPGYANTGFTASTVLSGVARPHPFGDQHSDSERSPFGIPLAELDTNCSAAGSAQGASDLIGSMAASTLIGCLGETLSSLARDSVGQCVLDAGRSDNGGQHPILGMGGGGLPVVLGVIGGSSCESNPLAQDSNGNAAVPKSQCSDRLGCAKQSAKDFYRSTEGTQFVTQMLLDAIEMRESALEQTSLKIGLIVGGSGELSDANKKSLADDRSRVKSDIKRYTEVGAQAISSATATSGFAVKTGNMGETRGTQIEVEAGHPTKDSLQSTLEHEAAHAILNAFFGTSPGSSQIDHHAVMKMQPAIFKDRWEAMVVSVIDWMEEQMEKHEEASDGDGNQQPGFEDPPCTAMSESFQDMLACRNPITTPLDGVDPDAQVSFLQITSRYGDTFLTPLPDDGSSPNGNHLEDVDSFQSCYAEYGMDPIGVDSEGRLVIGAIADPDNRRCGTINCAPPATAESVGGICRCVGPVLDQSRVMREQWARTFCYTSDACLPKDTWLDGKPFAIRVDELAAELLW